MSVWQTFGRKCMCMQVEAAVSHESVVLESVLVECAGLQQRIESDTSSCIGGVAAWL
jgi:hypothetical protein